MHQAQPKEGHKIWLTQEADAKSWSSLKHVQPKEGRKELAPREIKFRYRRLDTAIREPRESRQFPREAQERAKELRLRLFVLRAGYSSLLLISWQVLGLPRKRKRMQKKNRWVVPRSQNMADSRSRRQELVEPEACAT